MIKFLFKGLIRDRHRSLLPIIVTTTGVMLTVVFHAWISGVIGDSIEYNARFAAGHVKVMTAAYAENVEQNPNDLAITGTGDLVNSLQQQFPDMKWAERIHFAGLVDIPDENGETRIQGTAVGFGIDLLSAGSEEAERMNILSSMASGRLPEKQGEVMLSHMFAEKLGVKPGDQITLISTTMYGEMSVWNFMLCGTVKFGTTALDRGTIIADISDTRLALHMDDACGEILGFLKSGYYDKEIAEKVKHDFNQKHFDPSDEFSPVMKTLRDASTMGFLVDYSSILLEIMILVFIFAMSIILWNAGLLGGLRRYGEFGMRLAIGEEKNHVYLTMIYESLIIGVAGSLAGLTIGMSLAWFLQEHGIDFGMMMKNATIMMPSVFRARITPETWYIGFVPGVVSTVTGTMLSGIGIYKRQTAVLFKELQA